MVKPVGIFIGSIIYYVAFSVLFVLRLLWRPLQFLLLPVLYLGDFILRCILAPFRFLAKFEVMLRQRWKSRMLADRTHRRRCTSI